MLFGSLGNNQRLHLLCYVERHFIAIPGSKPSIFQRLITTWPCVWLLFMCLHTNRVFSSFCVRLFKLVFQLLVWWMQYYWFSLVPKSWKITLAVDKEKEHYIYIFFFFFLFTRYFSKVELQSILKRNKTELIKTGKSTKTETPTTKAKMSQ